MLMMKSQILMYVYTKLNPPYQEGLPTHTYLFLTNCSFCRCIICMLSYELKIIDVHNPKNGGRRSRRPVATSIYHNCISNETRMWVTMVPVVPWHHVQFTVASIKALRLNFPKDTDSSYLTSASAASVIVLVLVLVLVLILSRPSNWVANLSCADCIPMA